MGRGGWVSEPVGRRRGSRCTSSQGKDGGRVPPSLFTNRAAEHLQKTFAKDSPKQLPWIEKLSEQWIYLNRGSSKEAGVDAGKS